MASFTIGIKLSTTDSEGKRFTSAPTFVNAGSIMGMVDMSENVVKALGLLKNLGAIDSYSVVLKCDTYKDTPEARP